MELGLLIDNLSNPALLFFFLGLLAVHLKSDLEIPPNSSKFISIYLLFSIGFKGGVELSHRALDSEVFLTMAFGLSMAILVPIYCFFILKTRLGLHNAGAIAASYGSVSAVTFVTTVSYLELHQIEFDGHMVAIMAFMEAPAIIVGLLLINIFDKGCERSFSYRQVVAHAFTNGSVLLIIGSLVIGYMASDAQARGIEPFTTDIFKGFLALFLLDMGITSGRKLSSLLHNGKFTFAFAVLVPLFNGVLAAYASKYVTDNIGNQMLLAVLAASASYIAVPAAMKITAPKADPGLYVPMALAITFPLNITIGLPLYFWVVQYC